MKSKIKLKANERVEFSIDKEIYKSTVQDIISDTSIAISIPITGGKSYLPNIKEEVEFFILVNNDYYKYKGTVGNRIVDGNIRLLIIENLEYYGKIQRREFYRIPISLDILYIPISKEVAEKGISRKSLELLESKFIKAKSVDLSAGGIKIFTPEKLEVNTYIIVKFTLDSGENISIISKIVRVEKDIEMKIYKLGCRFEVLDKNDREKVVRFIFEKSRNLIKR